MSGFEHVMSHVLDLQAEINHAPLTVHGSQVALATLAGTEMYHRFLSDFDPTTVRIEDCFPTMDSMKEHIFASFGKIDPSGRAAAECWGDYQQKLEKWHAHRPDFEAALNDWDSLRSKLLKETRPADVILQILQKSGAPVRWSQLEPAISEEEAHFAFMNASLMRKRLTLGDILIFMGWDRESIWQNIWQTYA
jgi:glycerol-1-phosphate dehydrogenase [NAD(P)+]